MINSMSQNFDELREKNKKIRILSQAKMYKKLSTLMHG